MIKAPLTPVKGKRCFVFQMMKDQTLQNSLLPSSSQTHGEYTKINCTLWVFFHLLTSGFITPFLHYIKDLFILSRCTQVIYQPMGNQSLKMCCLLRSYFLCISFSDGSQIHKLILLNYSFHKEKHSLGSMF